MVPPSSANRIVDESIEGDGFGGRLASRGIILAGQFHEVIK